MDMLFFQIEKCKLKGTVIIQKGIHFSAFNIGKTKLEEIYSLQAAPYVDILLLRDHLRERKYDANMFYFNFNQKSSDYNYSFLINLDNDFFDLEEKFIKAFMGKKVVCQYSHTRFEYRKVTESGLIPIQAGNDPITSHLYNVLRTKMDMDGEKNKMVYIRRYPFTSFAMAITYEDTVIINRKLIEHMLTEKEFVLSSETLYNFLFYKRGVIEDAKTTSAAIGKAISLLNDWEMKYKVSDLVATVEKLRN